MHLPLVDRCHLIEKDVRNRQPVPSRGIVVRLEVRVLPKFEIFLFNRTDHVGDPRVVEAHFVLAQLVEGD